MDKEKVTAEEIKQAAAFHVYKVYGKSNYNAERDFIDGANFAIEKEDSDLVSRKELLETIKGDFADLNNQNPYRKMGNLDSYSKYAEGFSDALDTAEQAITSHLTQPKEGESFKALPDHPEKD